VRGQHARSADDGWHAQGDARAGRSNRFARWKPAARRWRRARWFRSLLESPVRRRSGSAFLANHFGPGAFGALKQFGWPRSGSSGKFIERQSGHGRGSTRSGHAVAMLAKNQRGNLRRRGRGVGSADQRAEAKSCRAAVPKPEHASGGQFELLCSEIREHVDGVRHDEHDRVGLVARFLDSPRMPRNNSNVAIDQVEPAFVGLADAGRR